MEETHGGIGVTVASKRLTQTGRREELQALIARSCYLLDEERFDDWIALFSDEASYTITAYSPELGLEQRWLEVLKDELLSLVMNIKNHIHDQGNRRHIAMVVDFEDCVTDGYVDTTSTFVVIRTDPHGASRVYATGKYLDRVDIQSMRIMTREVRLDSRMLEVGSHLPL